MANNSVAPKERINITYKTKTNNQEADVELPLKVMVMANLTGRNDTPVEDREVISINKTNFDQVMQKMDIKTNFTVDNKLGVGGEEINVELKISNMQDFSPDNIARQIPEINKLIELRKALVSLKGPMGNIPDFRKAVLDVLKDVKTKQELLLEIQDTKNINE
ncbi:MAG: type VI secretion system contractile sheath small subunit [Campylobacter sp.]|nr:type VI secretion system contractile sheath small subunit [Campylobacter sp.]